MQCLLQPSFAAHGKRSDFSFPTEIGWHFAPLLGLPLHYGRGETMGGEPSFGARDDLKELFGLGVAHKFGLALPLVHPQYGVVAVGIYRLLKSALLHQRKGVDNGEKLSDVVCAMDRAEMEHLFARGQVYATVFHRAGIAAARRVHRPSIGSHAHGQWQNSVVAVGWRIGWHLIVHIAGLCFLHINKYRGGKFHLQS